MVQKATVTTARRIMKAVRPYTSHHRVSSHPFSAKRAGLLVIDMQQYFLTRSSHAYLPDSKRIIGNVRELVASAHENSIPIVFTRHAHRTDEDPGTMGSWWGDVIHEGTRASKLSDELGIQESDKVLRKTRYSAFMGTGLERWLRTRGVSQLVITGVLTHLCCESTARDAFMRGFEVFLVVDATASSTMDLHISSIKTLTDGFAIPATTKEVLTWIGR